MFIIVLERKIHCPFNYDTSHFREVKIEKNLPFRIVVRSKLVFAKYLTLVSDTK